MLAVSKIFILSSSNILVATHDYRPDVKDACINNFIEKVKGSASLPPNCVINGVHFYHIRRNKVFFVACSRAEIFPLMAVEILTRFHHVCRELCGTVSDTSLQANLPLLYELLQEFMNEGYVQLDSSEKIRPYIQSSPVIVDTEKSPVKDLSSRVFGIESKTSPVNSASRPISQPAGQSGRPGFYVDVIEKMVTTVAADGSVPHTEVNGSVVVRNFLPAAPQFKMFLNEDLVIADQGQKGYGNQVQLDRCSFHACVQHDDFHNNKYIVMSPPVGEFSAMTYTASGEMCVRQPFSLRMFVSEPEGGGRDVCVVLRLQSLYPDHVRATRANVKVPLPASVVSVSTKLSSDNQSSQFDRQDATLTWTLSAVQGQSEHMAEFRLNVQGSGPVSRRDLDPVVLEFEISGFTSTGLAITHLKAHNIDKQQQQQQQQHFVRLITVSDSFVFRSF
ncbi:AP-4 complex subunit mu-1-like [Mya arenaria]|uniref:AP-4 complex subunit mu-1-like n=1 Tax=Mya arenaria TaxID=6604 RepID=UPI0022E31B1C|nr:AP-4 complex subunit mu-1-like [Mya arenaria]